MMEKQDFLENLYKEYLKRYIDYRTKNNNVFQISICDIEFEIIGLLKDFNYRDIKIAIISDKKDYSQAVEYRNNLKIDKIVILSPISVKKIDSLKDFNEYTIFPNIQEDDVWFWTIIEEIFEMEKNETKNFRKHITLIIQEKKISLTQLLEYIRCCISAKSIDTELLNKNLYLVNCWKSNSKEIIKRADLKKLIQLSESTEVEKRISNIIANDIQVKNITQFNKVKKLVFANDFENLFKGYSYEDMPEEFKKRSPKVKREKPPSENQETLSEYIFSYDAFIEDGQGQELEELESMLLNEQSDIKLSEDEIHKFNDFMDNYNLENDIIKIKNIINEVQNRMNINPNAKIELISVLNEFLESTRKTLEKIKDNKIYPMYLVSYCKITKEFFGKYFELCSLIITNEAIFKAFSENHILEKIQNLFTTIDGSSINVCFFHPVAIFYFASLKEKYEEICTDIKNCDNEALEIILKNLISRNKNKFPIKILLDKGDKYILNSNFNIVNTHFKFNKKDSLSNSTLVDARIITNKIKEYILTFPYKAEINVSIVGDISFDNIETLYKTVSQILEKEESLLRTLQINIISPDDKRIKDSLTQLKENGYFNDNIQYSFLKNKYILDGILSLEKIINDVDVLFLLDCDLLYKKDSLQNIENQNNILYDIETLNKDKWMDSFSKGNFNFIGIIWDSLQNVLLNGYRELSEWNSNVLDNNTINLIQERISNKKELMVVLLTSNLKAAEEIFITEGCLANTNKNYSGELLILTFSSSLHNEIYLENNESSKCWCSLKGILDSVIDNSQIKEFVDYTQGEYEQNLDYLENCIFEFVYEYSSDNLIINCIDNQKSTDQNNNWENYLSILRYSFNGDSNMSKLFKDIIIDLLYSSIENYGDALLVNHIANYYKLNEEYVQYLTKENTIGQAIKISRDWFGIRNIISYIEKYYRPDLKFKTVYKNKYDRSYLEHLLNQAKRMPINNDSLIKKMEYILKGD